MPAQYRTPRRRSAGTSAAPYRAWPMLRLYGSGQSAPSPESNSPTRTPGSAAAPCSGSRPPRQVAWLRASGVPSLQDRMALRGQFDEDRPVRIVLANARPRPGPYPARDVGKLRPLAMPRATGEMHQHYAFAAGDEFAQV